MLKPNMQLGVLLSLGSIALEAHDQDRMAWLLFLLASIMLTTMVIDGLALFDGEFDDYFDWEY